MKTFVWRGSPVFNFHDMDDGAARAPRKAGMDPHRRAKVFLASVHHKREGSMDFTFQKQNARKYFQGRRSALVAPDLRMRYRAAASAMRMRPWMTDCSQTVRSSRSRRRCFRQGRATTILRLLRHCRARARLVKGENIRLMAQTGLGMGAFGRGNRAA